MKKWKDLSKEERKQLKKVPIAQLKEHNVLPPWYANPLKLFGALFLLFVVVLLGGVCISKLQYNMNMSKIQEALVTATPEQFLAIQSELVLGTRTNMKKDRYIGINTDDPSMPQIHLNGDENLTKGMQRSTFLYDCKDFFKAIKNDTKIDSFDKISVVFYLPLTDTYGNVKDDHVFILDMKVSEIKKVNWDNFNVDNFDTISDRLWYHDAIK